MMHTIIFNYMHENNPYPKGRPAGAGIRIDWCPRKNGSDPSRVAVPDFSGKSETPHCIRWEPKNNSRCSSPSQRVWQIVVLADTSVWIHHLRESSAALIGLLELNQVAIHPFVIGELACGNLKHRQEAILELEILPRTAVPGYHDVMEFIDRYKLHGKGIGLVDAHLLASCSSSEALLWTKDIRLHKIAAGLEIAFKET